MTGIFGFEFFTKTARFLQEFQTESLNLMARVFL